MAAWSSWFDDVLPELPGALPAVVEHALRRAAQELFRRSKVWKVDVAVALEAGEGDYTIAPGDGMTPVQVISASGFDLYLADEDMQTAFGPEWRTQTGATTDLLVTSPNTLRAFPIPDEDGSLVLSVAVMPSDASTGIRDDLAERFREGIAAGALARLMMSPKKPYTNEAQAAFYLQKFESAVGDAISDRASGFGQARSRRRVTWY